jgi:hypothetical protein
VLVEEEELLAVVVDVVVVSLLQPAYRPTASTRPGTAMRASFMENLLEGT